MLCGGGWSGGEDLGAVGEPGVGRTAGRQRLRVRVRVKVTHAFVQNEVVCDYNGKLLTNKEGKEKYKNSQEQAM